MRKTLIFTGVILLITALVIVAVCVGVINMGLLDSDSEADLGEALGGALLFIIGLIFAISWPVAIILFAVFGIVLLVVENATIKTKRALVGLSISTGIVGIFFYIANILMRAAVTALGIPLLGTLLWVSSVMYLVTFITSLVAHGKVRKYLKNAPTQN